MCVIHIFVVPAEAGIQGSVFDLMTHDRLLFRAINRLLHEGLLSEETIHYGIARTNHLIVRAAQAARGRGITFTKAVKSLLSLRDPDDKVVRAILSFGYSVTFINIARLMF